MNFSGRTNVVLIVVGVVWAAAVGLGLWVLGDYATAQGSAAAAPAEWPADSPLQKGADRPTLVVMVHPRCPCSRASIGELALLMARCQGRVTTYVAFLRPAGFPVDWEKTDLWRSAAAIPGVTLVSDEGGVEAARFHAATSGQAILYDAQGRLLFSGGITAARGHAGDNAGREAIVAILTRGETARTETPVFGCSLLDENSTCRREADSCNK